MQTRGYLSGFLLISLLLTASTPANAATKPIELIINEKTITIDGKPTQVYSVTQPDGTWGFTGTQGEYFDATVKNHTHVPTVLHWHGLIVPNNQDGVPFVTQPPIPPGGEYHYHFKLLQAGTFWMHSHYDLQVQRYMSAPFIIHEREEAQDVVMLLADYSPLSAETIFADLKKGKPMQMTMTNQPDINDVQYAACLTNYHTLKDPEIIRVKPGSLVRLRIINGAAMSSFFVNTGVLPGTLIAVDGEDIKPIKEKQFQIAEAQRLDILVKIPKTKNAVYPILAQSQGTQLQTGLLLATPDAKDIPSISETAPQVAGTLDYSQEWQLKAAHPLAKKPVDESLILNLEGDMTKYEWKINNQMWPNITPLLINQKKRVELVINNQTNMAHPIHFHGHVFEVTEMDNKPVIDGALRDTVFVMPHSTVKVVFDSDNPGKWVTHCHMLYHQEAGMMTEIDYEEVK